MRPGDLIFAEIVGADEAVPLHVKEIVRRKNGQRWVVTVEGPIIPQSACDKPARIGEMVRVEGTGLPPIDGRDFPVVGVCEARDWVRIEVPERRYEDVAMPSSPYKNDGRAGMKETVWLPAGTLLVATRFVEAIS